MRTARDGRAALAAAAEFTPDVVLLDIGLSGMSGYEVAEHLRNSRCMFVAMTGHGQPEDAQRAQQAGCAEHLVKPVDPERLQRLLAEVAPRRG